MADQRFLTIPSGETDLKALYGRNIEHIQGMEALSAEPSNKRFKTALAKAVLAPHPRLVGHLISNYPNFYEPNELVQEDDIPEVLTTEESLQRNFIMWATGYLSNRKTVSKWSKRGKWAKRYLSAKNDWNWINRFFSSLLSPSEIDARWMDLARRLILGDREIRERMPKLFWPTVEFVSAHGGMKFPENLFRRESSGGRTAWVRRVDDGENFLTAAIRERKWHILPDDYQDWGFIFSPRVVCALIGAKRWDWLQKAYDESEWNLFGNYPYEYVRDVVLCGAAKNKKWEFILPALERKIQIHPFTLGMILFYAYIRGRSDIVELINLNYSDIKCLGFPWQRNREKICSFINAFMSWKKEHVFQDFVGILKEAASNKGWLFIARVLKHPIITFRLCYRGRPRYLFERGGGYRCGLTYETQDAIKLIVDLSEKIVTPLLGEQGEWDMVHRVMELQDVVCGKVALPFRENAIMELWAILRKVYSTEPESELHPQKNVVEIAAEKKQWNFVKAALDRERPLTANTNVIAKLAAEDDQWEIVLQILQKVGINPTMLGRIVHIATTHHNWEIVDQLIQSPHKIDASWMGTILKDLAEFQHWVQVDWILHSPRPVFPSKLGVCLKIAAENDQWRIVRNVISSDRAVSSSRLGDCVKIARERGRSDVAQVIMESGREVAEELKEGKKVSLPI